MNVPCHVDGNLNIQLPDPHNQCPTDIEKFLLGQGWVQGGGYPNIRFIRREDRQEFHWHEAMAIEFYKFITIGGR